MNDHELLRAFLDRRDERAFALIVDRYIGLVYNAALRQLRGDAHQAEDVTQAVFILLARKADTIQDRQVLAGWLINAARLCARSAARDDANRTRRESKAAAMAAHVKDDQQSGAQHDELDRLHLVLDEALGSLSEDDRTAVTLRYLQSKPFKEVAAALGISEAAAAKRVIRATAKLSHFFRQTELGFASPVILTEGLLHLRNTVAPPGLASATTAAGMSGGSGAALAIVTVIDVAGELAAKSAVAMVPRVIAALVLGAAFLALVTGWWSFTVVRAPATTRTQVSSTTSPKKIRVGYYLSEATALASDFGTGKPNGYSLRLYDQIRDDAFDIVPVIEPGTADHADLKQMLATSFPGKAPLNAADANDLKTLDVFLGGAIYCPEEVVAAVEEAVEQGGVGLMTRSQFCFGSPGYTPQVLRLYGLEQGHFGMLANSAVSCELMAEHPILGSRTGKPGAALMMRPSGVYGIAGPKTTGLIKLKDINTLTTGRDSNPNYKFYTVYVSELGKGRIVSCCHSTYDTAKHVNEAVGPDFLKRSVKWLARRPVE